MANDNSNIPAPYVGYGVFKTTVDNLADSTVPTGALDRRVLHWLSGADYGALMSGMRFLGFIDEGKKATESYRTLVQLSKDSAKFKGALLETITAKYKPIIGTMNLKSGTITELEKAFKEYGVTTGQMLTKTIRFYLKALSECGYEVSPHITKARPRAPRAASSKNGGGKVRTTNKPLPAAPDTTEAPRGFERMPIPGVANAFIQYPVELTEAHCKMFDATITVLRAYVQSHAGGKEKRP